MDHPDNISTPQRMSMPSSEQQTIDEFWRKKQDEIEAIEDFSKRVIPMTCLKKVLCAEKGKMMMTFDTPSFVTKACEIFVQELSLRSWMCANSHHRDIILDSDIAEAIASMESYDFLNDVLCKYQGEHNSAHHPKSIKKRSHNRLTDQPQTVMNDVWNMK
jgi:nuclear transcription factor Y gamma